MTLKVMSIPERFVRFETAKETTRKELSAKLDSILEKEEFDLGICRGLETKYKGTLVMQMNCKSTVRVYDLRKSN